MSITGAPTVRPSGSASRSPTSSSGMFAAQGVAMALLARERTGRGQQVDVAMLDAVAALLTYQAGIYFATGKRAGAARQPPSDHRAVRDVRRVGRRVRARGRQRRAVAAVLRGDRPAALPDDERFATNRARVRHYDELRPIAGRAAANPSRAADWVTRSQGGGRSVRVGPRRRRSVRPIRSWRPREMIATVEHVTAGAAAGARRTGQAVGHAGRGANGAAGARPAHR